MTFPGRAELHAAPAERVPGKPALIALGAGEARCERLM
jgi:hypothetical protein